MQNVSPSPRLRWLTLGASVVASSLALAVGSPSAKADVPLTRADLETIVNRVEFISRGRQARVARLSDFMAVGDTLRTAAQSQAQLRFNDGSLARVGERATFRFIPNTRNFRLSDGTMLLLIPPGRGRSTIQTPSAITGIQGSAVVVRHIEDRNLTIVMALTNNPAGPMTVTTAACGDATGMEGAGCVTEHTLYAGQMALVQDNRVQILDFDLPAFYQTSPLIDGLELNNPSPDVSLGPALDQVRAETLEALSRDYAFADATVLNPALVGLGSSESENLASQPWLLSPSLAADETWDRGRSSLVPGRSLTGIPVVTPTERGAAPVVTQAISRPAEVSPPSRTSLPPAASPPSTPPATTPPVATPTPPVATPPVTTPPVATPPVATPPVATPTPPVATPPVATPPVVTPPVTTPTPPVATPPVATPTPPVVAPTPPVTTPTPPVVAPTPPVATPPVVAPTPPVVTPTPPVETPTPPVVAPTPPVVAPTPPVETPTPPVVAPTPEPNPGGPTVPASPPPFAEDPVVPARPPANPPVEFDAPVK